MKDRKNRMKSKIRNNRNNDKNGWGDKKKETDRKKEKKKERNHITVVQSCTCVRVLPGNRLWDRV